MADQRYTVNQVEARTEVPASTLRQWERRYGFPKPERSRSGYRLYCEADIESIEEMKRFIASGMPASRAAEQVVQRIARKRRPAYSLPVLRSHLIEALLAYDEAGAERVLSQAYSLFEFEQVLSQVVQAVMRTIRELWLRGEVSAAAEHFAKAYLEGRVRTLMNAVANPEGETGVIVACAPAEHDELGALILATLLRRRGYRVYYFGADMPVGELLEPVDQLGIVGVMIWASSEGSLEALSGVRGELRGLAPVLVFGGEAFDRSPERATELYGHYFASDAVAVRRFGELIRERGTLSA